MTWGSAHFSEPVELNAQKGALRLRETQIPPQGSTVSEAELELEPRSPVTQSSGGFPGSRELSMVPTPDPHSLP